VEFDCRLLVMHPAETKAVPECIKVMPGVIRQTELLLEQFIELVIISDFGEINDNGIFGDGLIHVIFDGMFFFHDKFLSIRFR